MESVVPNLAPEVRQALLEGAVIPAHPLALTAERKLDERRQRALTRYYLAAGAGGVAVGVHTTQFAIRNVGLLQPVLELAAETAKEHEGRKRPPVLRVAGVCGKTKQAVAEARLAADLGYHAGLLSLGHGDGVHSEAAEHARAVAEILPVFGFYLQPAVGGRALPYDFWRRFCGIDGVVAIKAAPFNRYQTLELLRGVADSGRADEIALYTGNDDNIIGDLTGVWRFAGHPGELRFVGGLLGHWAVWTRRAWEHWKECRRVATQGLPVPRALLQLGNEITDANAAFFDPQHGFHGCIAGLHEVLRRQGLLEGLWTLDPAEGLSPGQAAEIDRVHAAYPHLADDGFIAEHKDAWLA